MEFKRFQRFLIIGLLALFSFLIRGYKFGVGNHKFQLPLIFKAANDALYPLDYVFHFSHENSLYYPLISFFGKFFALEPFMLILYLFLSLLYVVALYKIASLFFKDDMVSFLAIALLILMKPAFGTDMTFRAILYHITFAIPLLLFSLYFFFRARYLWSFLFLGVAFNIHALSSLHVLALYGISFLVQFKAVDKKRFLQGAGLFALMALPLVLLSDTSGHSLVSADPSWVSLMKSVDFAHSFPFQWSLHQYLSVTPLVLLGIFSFFYFKRHSPLAKTPLHRMVLSFSFGFLVLALAGVVFTQWYPIEFVIASQLFRSTLFLSTLIMLYTAFMVVDLLRTKRFAEASIALLLCASLFFYDYVALWLVLPFVGVVSLSKTYRSILRYAPLFYAGVALAIPVFFSLIGRFEFVYAVLRHLFTPFVVLLLLVLVAILTRFVARTPSHHTFFALGILTFVLLVPVSLAWHQESFSTHVSYPYIVEKNDWTTLARWIRLNTDLDATFLIPPYHRDFRLLAQRGVYVDSDSGPAYFSKEAANEWVERLDKIGISPDEISVETIDHAYASLTSEQIYTLSEEYGFDHVIFPRDAQTLKFPVAYIGKEYLLYKIVYLP